MFLKVMNVVKEIEGFSKCTSLSSAQLGKEICRNVSKIQAKPFLFVENIEDCDLGCVSKFMKGFWKDKSFSKLNVFLLLIK